MNTNEKICCIILANNWEESTQRTAFYRAGKECYMNKRTEEEENRLIHFGIPNQLAWVSSAMCCRIKRSTMKRAYIECDQQ